MSLGYNALPSSGPITISYLNDYFGCSSTTTRAISGIGSAPNFSVNQIFNSTYNTATPPNSNMQLISLRYYKTFGIFTNYNRNSLVSNLTTVPGPVWYGYLGFGGTSTGTSGILNPSNRGFPMSIRIRIISGSRYDLYVEYTENQSTFQWSSQTLTSNDTSFVQEACAIRITGTSIFSDVVAEITVAPSLDGTTRGTGSHTVRITFPSEEPSSSGGLKDLR